MRRAGSAAGNMWRFIRDMTEGDYVVVPDGPVFYLGRIDGPARYEPAFAADDTAYRRSVEWLNKGEGIPRLLARAALQSRMKARQACVYAGDLVKEIEAVLAGASATPGANFQSDLRRLLVTLTLGELRSGRMNGPELERLIMKLLTALGAENVRQIPTRVDKGADVVGDFKVAGTLSMRLAVQAKHYGPTPLVPADVVENLAEGMQAESADFGWVATTGSFSDGAYDKKDELAETEGLKIDLIDGELLAAMILEAGLTSFSM